MGRWKSIGKCYTNPPTDKEILGVLKSFSKKEAAALAKPKKGRNAFRPDYLLLDGGTPPKKGSAFWTENVVIDNTRGEALAMTLRTLEGKQFLLVEIGGFPDTVTPEFNCAHNLYIKE